MKTAMHTWVRALVIFGLLMALLASAATAFAELTEAEKQALEAQLKAAELAKEAQNQQPQAPELTEAEKQALEVQLKAAELANQPQQDGQGQGGNHGQANNPPITGRLSGYISAFTSNSLTVGIIGNNTFSVTGRTFITNNGQISNLYRGVFIGDTVSVQFDPATNEALRIEIEGFGFPATYQNVGVQITYIGPIGHWPQDFGMHAGGAGLKLGLSTQVTINGVPATIQDLQVGDTIDYVQSSIDLTALWVKVTR